MEICGKRRRAQGAWPTRGKGKKWLETRRFGAVENGELAIGAPGCISACSACGGDYEDPEQSRWVGGENDAEEDDAPENGEDVDGCASQSNQPEDKRGGCTTEPEDASDPAEFPAPRS